MHENCKMIIVISYLTYSISWLTEWKMKCIGKMELSHFLRDWKEIEMNVPSAILFAQKGGNKKKRHYLQKRGADKRDVWIHRDGLWLMEHSCHPYYLSLFPMFTQLLFLAAHFFEQNKLSMGYCVTIYGAVI